MLYKYEIGDHVELHSTFENGAFNGLRGRILKRFIYRDLAEYEIDWGFTDYSDWDTEVMLGRPGLAFYESDLKAVSALEQLAELIEE